MIAHATASGIRAVTIIAMSCGLPLHGLLVAAIGVPLMLIPTPAYAACSGGGSQTSTYNYTAANLANDATINFPIAISCSTASGLSICFGIKSDFYVRNTANTATVMTVRQDYSDTTHGRSGTTMDQSGSTMYGPFGPGGTGTMSMNMVISTLVRAGATASKPAGTYTDTFQVFLTTTTSTTTCPAYGTTAVDSMTISLTANYIIPTNCSLTGSPAINFGTVSSIGPTASRRDATGTFTLNCNATYTVYISDGNNRVSPGSGNRQMARGAERLPYQLYKDNARTQIWDETGGTAATGGSGGVSGTNTFGSSAQTIYAAIPVGTTVPATTGSYSDTVVVTLTY